MTIQAATTACCKLQLCQKSCGIQKWICKRFWVKHEFFLPGNALSGKKLSSSEDLVVIFSQDRTHILVKHFFDDDHYSTKEALLRAICAKKLPMKHNAMYTGTLTSWHAAFVTLQLFYCIMNQDWEWPRKAVSSRLEDVEKFGRRV